MYSFANRRRTDWMPSCISPSFNSGLLSNVAVIGAVLLWKKSLNHHLSMLWIILKSAACTHPLASPNSCYLFTKWFIRSQNQSHFNTRNWCSFIYQWLKVTVMSGMINSFPHTLNVIRNVLVFFKTVISSISSSCFESETKTMQRGRKSAHQVVLSRSMTDVYLKELPDFKGCRYFSRGFGFRGCVAPGGKQDVPKASFHLSRAGKKIKSGEFRFEWNLLYFSELL